jgi:tRNA C32,U32 (ribose-2'-O)-methylase TrmJ
MLGLSKRKKQTGMEILREADPDCSQQQLDKFYKRLTDIMGSVGITDDPHTNIIQVLRKVEEALNFHCAARNFLADKFKRENKKIDKMDIE